MPWPAEIERHHSAGPGAIARRVRRLGALRIGLVQPPQRRLSPQDREALSALAAMLGVGWTCTDMGPRQAVRALRNGSLALAITCDAPHADDGLRRIAFSSRDGHAWWVADDPHWRRTLAWIHLRQRLRLPRGGRDEAAQRVRRAL